MSERMLKIYEIKHNEKIITVTKLHNGYWYEALSASMKLIKINDLDLVLEIREQAKMQDKEAKIIPRVDEALTEILNCKIGERVLLQDEYKVNTYVERAPNGYSPVAYYASDSEEVESLTLCDPYGFQFSALNLKHMLYCHFEYCVDYGM